MLVAACVIIGVSVCVFGSPSTRTVTVCVVAQFRDVKVNWLLFVPLPPVIVRPVPDGVTTTSLSGWEPRRSV